MSNSSDLNTNLSYNSKRAKSAGSRYTPVNSDQEFARDIDTLYVKYANLRKSLYRRLAKSVPSDADRDDLISYINETFVKLVKEYDPTSGVDFPGYIYKMLPMRTKALYVRPTNREHERQVATEDEELLGKLDTAEDDVLVEDLEHLISYVSTQVHLTEEDKYIMTLIADGLSDTKIGRILVEQNDDYDLAEGKHRVADVKEMLGYVLKDYKS